MKQNSSFKKQKSLIERLKLRLFLAVGMLILGLIFSFAVGIFASTNQQNLGEQKVVIRDDLNGILRSMIDQETGVRGYITTDNTVFLEPFNSGRPQYLLNSQQLKDQIGKYNFNDTMATLSQVESQADDWYNNFALVQIKNMQDGKFSLARSESSSNTGKAKFDRFRSTVTDLQQEVDTDLAGLQYRVNVINYIAIAGAGLLTVIALIILLRTLSRFTSDLHAQLQTFKEATNHLEAGDLTTRVHGLTDVELNQLGENFNLMARALQDQQNVLKERDVLESVLQLNSILKNSLDLNALIQQFLNRVLSLLDLQLGVIYFYDAESKLLTLMAAQGSSYNNLETEFKLGEGTVGRVALGMEPLLLTEAASIENRSFHIKSLFGTAPPESIYLIPLLRGNELLGVLGIGSSTLVNENARNVLNVVASNLAASISTIRAYQRISMQAKELARHNLEQEQANIELRQQRDELSTLNAALEEANRTRSHFLSIMSHELRTPLTSIIGFTQIMMRDPAGNLNHRQKENLERILKNSHHLLSLINGVLDLARIEMGRMEVSQSEVDLRALISSVSDEMQSIAAARGLNLQVHIDDDIPFLQTDAIKLRQVILNLVSNALKFTEEGKVSITVTRENAVGTENDQDSITEEFIAIAVKDTGIGIAPEIQERIFEAFYQADSSNTRKYGGAGLGLSTVHQLITLLEGRVEVKSTPGQGSIFTVYLPARQVFAQEEQEEEIQLRQQMPLPMKRRTR